MFIGVALQFRVTVRWKEDESIFEGHHVIVDQTGPERTLSQTMMSLGLTTTYVYVYIDVLCAYRVEAV